MILIEYPVHSYCETSPFVTSKTHEIFVAAEAQTPVLPSSSTGTAPSYSYFTIIGLESQVDNTASMTCFCPQTYIVNST